VHKACGRPCANKIEIELIVERGVDRARRTDQKERVSVRGRMHRFGADIAAWVDRDARTAIGQSALRGRQSAHGTIQRTGLTANSLVEQSQPCRLRHANQEVRSIPARFANSTPYLFGASRNRNISNAPRRKRIQYGIDDGDWGSSISRLTATFSPERIAFGWHWSKL
jgi:hypothetical protein